MRKLFLGLFAAFSAFAFYLMVASYSHADLNKLPPLESGDLIFETTLTNQTAAIMLATGSIYTHVGIIHKNTDGYSVIHAAHRVKESPLSEFIESGWGEHFTILRYPGLTQARRDAIVKDAESFIGRNYNFEFTMKSKDIYCSELPYFAFEQEHLPIGSLQKIGDLYMNNPATRALFDKRWRQHPACQAPGMNADACWKAVMDEPIITPVSLAHDPKLVRIYSNYLF